MFEISSRYYQLGELELTTDAGRVIKYTRRRRVPAAEALSLLAEVTLNQEDRLDLIAARTLGDPEQFWRICDANNVLNPYELLETLGRTIRIPLPQP